MEENEVNDQDLGRVEETELDSDTQATEEQSGTTEGEEQELFELPDGKKVDAATLSKEWRENFYPEFTKRSQKLSEYEREVMEREAKAQQETEQSLGNNELLQNVDPTVKEAIIQIVSPVIKDALLEKDRVAEQREKDRALEQKLSSLESTYAGKDGLPKFDRREVMNAMLDPNNSIFDPEKKFKDMYEAKFQDALIKKALKQKSGGAETESTAQDTPRKPEGKTPKTYEEAANSLLNRLRNA